MNTISQQNKAHFHIFLDSKKVKENTIPPLLGRFWESLYSHGKEENVNMLKINFR